MEEERRRGRLDRMCLFLSRYRLAVFIGILVLTVIFLYGALRIRGEVILQDMFPYDHPYLKLHERFSEVFGSGGSTVAIALKANKGEIFNEAFLGKLQKMTKEVMMLGGGLPGPDRIDCGAIGQGGQDVKERGDQH